MCNANNPLLLVLCIVSFILTCLYTYPNTPLLSIEDFSVPAFNKTSDNDQTNNNIYFDLKLRNMNKAIGLYYDDPFTLSFSYYPLEQPYQKYAWVCTVPAFYQGNGKTKHIKALMGNNNQVMVVDNEDHEESNHVRSLLRDQELEETNNQLMVVEVVRFRVELVMNYRFKLWADSSTRELELGGDVMVDANTGERVTAGSIKLVESDAVAGGPVMVVVLFASFLLIVCF